ncbi:hypothetical protein HPHPA26_1429 [Helicobacter pylori Hp A-26]|uniref:Uncharacterized protein n=1 Tax=Helicobacter pylori Hp A-26 TaxID=992056 RepID=J0CG45_HELPX|nr:hypothetical protein HPHPA26_1429 [Helicobacter pylori Hp A-26]
MCVSVSIVARSFCSRIACVFSLSSLELFSVSFILSHVFVLLSHSNAPF